MKAALYLFLFIFTQYVCAEMDTTASQQSYFTIENNQIKESSGLACSKQNTALLWTHNDSGHMPVIYAMSDKGEDLGTFFLEDVVSRDWEDMASFKRDGQAYLLVADTGDNFKIFRAYTLSIFKEPELSTKVKSALSPLWQVKYRFPDNQSYDVEAVSVDVQRDKVILLTKRTPFAQVYEVPLGKETVSDIVVAEKVGEFNEIVNPTAADMTADGNLLLVLTYGRVHLFDKQRTSATQPHVRYIKRKQVIKYKGLFQPEAMCLSADKQSIYVTSERKSGLIKIKTQQYIK